MITENEISMLSNPRAFARGRSIASSKRDILTKQVRYDGFDTQVSAFVASSSGWSDRYRTSISIDEDNNEIIDYSCTCPAFREYSGMCKHCVALALNFSRHPQDYIGWQPGRKAASSLCITDFMRRADEAQTDPTPPGSVELIPELSYGFGLWSASFRIKGPLGTAYVVKNIDDLVDRVELRERHSYGKKLAFVHSPLAFDDQSRRIMDLLQRACETRRVGSSSWYYSRSQTVGRTLSMTQGETVELMDLLEGRRFSIKSTDYSTPSVERVHLVDGDPPIELALEKSDRGFWTVERGKPLRIAQQGDKVFVWLGEDALYRCSEDFARCVDFLLTVYNSDDRVITVAEDDMPLFCAAVLPTIERSLKVKAPESIDKYRRVPCKLRFYFDKDGKGVEVRAEAAYGERAFTLRGADPAPGGGEAEAGKPGREDAGATSPVPLRDKRAEQAACALVDNYFGLDAYRLPMSAEDAVGQLLFAGLAEFRALGEVFTTPAFDKLIREGKPRLTMGVSLSGNLINLDVQADDLESDELAALLSAYRKKKRYHKLRGGAFVDLGDFDLSQLDRLASDLGFSVKDLAAGNIELPTYRAFYLDEEEDLDRDRSFEDYLANFKRVNEADYELPASLEGVLRPYQAEGFRWLSARCDAGFGGVLADEMGLGKSLQLISLLLARRAEGRQVGPSIIVCPSSLVYNWTAEFERFAPELTVVAVAGTAAERKRARGKVFSDWEAALSGGAGAAAAGAGSSAAADAAAAGGESVSTGDRTDEGLVDVLITSYDLARIDIADWTGRAFFICAIDEAQYIKNPATLTTRAVKRLEARHRFALTGTPMENRLSELWSIFDFLMPGLLGPYARFRERFELPIVGGDEDVARRLQALVGPFMLRRCKADVLTDLPEKLESVVYAPLEGKQRQLYAAHEQHLREQLTRQRAERKQRAVKRASGEEVSTVEVLAELTKLRQLCCDPRLLFEDYHGRGAKLSTIMELVASAMEGGEKTLVFSQFTSFLDLIAEQLDEAGTPYYTITGSTPKAARVKLVDTFNENDVPVFLVSLKAGGTGLNLTGASVVIHADPWWNAAAQQQATDRAHRIGQTRVVSVQKVIAKGTIEERILRLQEEKSKLADQVIGASGVSLASLSTDDLIELLEG